VVVFDREACSLGEPVQLFVKAAARETLYPPTGRARQMVVMAGRTNRVAVTCTGMQAMQHAQVGQHVDRPKHGRTSHSGGAEAVRQRLGGERTFLPENRTDNGAAWLSSTVSGEGQHVFPLLARRVQIHLNLSVHTLIVTLVHQHVAAIALLPVLLSARQPRELPSPGRTVR
jgi:hypothetical protein